MALTKSPVQFSKFVFPRLIAFAAFAWLATAAGASDAVIVRATVHAHAFPAGDAPNSFVAADYQGNLRDLPIGVFDSGVGGLTVFEAIKNFDVFNNHTGQPGADGVPDFANENFIYLGDQANMPYGNYPAVQKTDFLRELILRDAAFLLGRRFWRAADETGAVMTKPPVKAIVIACNTATAYGLDDIRAAAKAWGVPVITVGVVEAGARGLAETRGDHTGTIAVFATVGTCASNAYPRAITRALGDNTANVWQRGSVTLAAAIEGDASVKESVPDIVNFEVRSLLDERVAHGGKAIDTIVLGCTHYPLVEQDFLTVLAQWRNYTAADGQQPYADLVAEKIHVVDPAKWTAQDLWRSLTQSDLWRSTPAVGGDQFYISVANPQWPGVQLDADGGLDRAYKYGREAGELTREDTIVVPLTPDRLPASSAKLVREHLPKTWASLVEASKIAKTAYGSTH
ncbi:MAG: aspartate/glutamate racemase family protein [Candidatus Didemnitutus sp.]|nr:aspartate/glutamate racemase family protein [Candidatus Didemnitutus sp.]